MKNIGTQTLITDRLILRRFTVEDAEDAFHGWYHDADASRYMRWIPHDTMEQTKELLQTIVADYGKADQYRWAVTLKPVDKAIGAIGLTIENEYDSVASFAYLLNKAYRNRGIITEVLRAIFDYAFLSVGVNRMEAYHACKNPASGKVMQKAGMKYEGHARQKFRGKDGYEDCDLYAIIAEDWRATNACVPAACRPFGIG